MNKKSSNSVGITPEGASSILGEAVDLGFSKNAANLMVEGLNALTLAGADGVDPSLLSKDYVTLVCMVLDETGSMTDNQDAVIDAYNNMIAAMKGSREVETILLSTWLFNETSKLLHSYLPLNSVPELTAAEYDPAGMTALFDATFNAATSTFLYARELRENQGYQVKVVFVVVTDGWDNFSVERTESDINLLLSELTDEEIYTFAMVGFGGSAFRVGTDMGFLPQNIRKGSEDPTASELRKFFNMVSKSVVRASQTLVTDSNQSFFT